MKDELRRAYAILGLPHTASPAQVKQRYRTLVKSWHPDRFASDPAGQAEATDHLTRFNQAFRLLSAQLARAAGRAAAPERSPASTTRRLSREEIESMVRAIGTSSPVDDLLSILDSSKGPLARYVHWLPFVVVILGLILSVVRN